MLNRFYTVSTIVSLRRPVKIAAKPRGLWTWRATVAPTDCVVSRSKVEIAACGRDVETGRDSVIKSSVIVGRESRDRIDSFFSRSYACQPKSKILRNLFSRDSTLGREKSISVHGRSVSYSGKPWLHPGVWRTMRWVTKSCGQISVCCFISNLPLSVFSISPSLFYGLGLK